MKIFLDVIGCRLNQSEIEGFANIFRALGHQIVSEPAQADLAIVNTCAVTVKAAADSRKRLRRAGREGAREVIATGCWATLHPGAALDLPGVNEVFVNDQKDSLVAEILDLPVDAISKLSLVREPLPGDRARTRAFIKVQEGCDNHCTYCLTRVARGKSRSRTLMEIKTDIRSALAGGAKEIVLTGVQMGAWGRDFPTPIGFGKLLSGILEMEGFARLRLSSIEPWDFNPAYLSFWEDQRLCRHLHIPLQSGHDGILKAMRRPITRRDYLALIENVRLEIPDMAITTDVICGFPGETEAAFNETASLVHEIGFAGGHVFTYSPRPGTAAFNMNGQVPIQIAKAHNAVLRKIFKKIGRAYRNRFIGERLPVLWESSNQVDTGHWRLSGLTDNYIRVYATSGSDLWNEISLVDLHSHHPRRKALMGHVMDN